MNPLSILWRYFISCALVCALMACASAPIKTQSSVKKVQTLEELLIKLKNNFEGGTFVSADFYTNELGYPLPQSLDYSPLKRAHITSAEGFNYFDKGTLIGSHFRVLTGKYDNERRTLSLWVSQIRGCFDLAHLHRIWGVENLIQIPDTALHRTGATNPPLYYQANKQINGLMRSATFNIGSNDGCLSTVYISENF